MKNIKNNEHDMEKRLMEFNMLNARLQELEQQMQIIEKQISELHATHLALKDLEETPTETEMLTSIGQNVYVKANLKNNQEVFVDVGARIFAKKKLDEAQEINNKKIDEFINVRDQITQQVQIISEQMLEIEQEFKEQGKI